MHQTIKPANTLKKILNTAFLLLLLPGSVYAAQSKQQSTENSAPIVVTIKPLYSLVAHLTEGIESPVLLMKQMQSPHHYNMKPSERRLLTQARMIIWLGPQLESYLSKIIQQEKSASVVTVTHAEGLTLFRLRHKHSADEHDHKASEKLAFSIAESQIDPHIWLSISNTIAISKQITAALIKDNPANSRLYKENLQRLLQKIEQTKTFMHSTLQANKQPFIAFHDAFQYFEEENGLNYIDSIRFDDETASGMKHIRQINTLIGTQNIRCLVYQIPKPAIVRTLTTQHTIKATALDPLGQNVHDNKNAWFIIMQQLTLNFHHCLTP